MVMDSSTGREMAEGVIYDFVAPFYQTVGSMEQLCLPVEVCIVKLSMFCFIQPSLSYLCTDLGRLCMSLLKQY